MRNENLDWFNMTLCYWMNTAKVVNHVFFTFPVCLGFFGGGIISLCFFKKKTLTLLLRGFFEDWILENTKKSKRGERSKQVDWYNDTVLRRAIGPCSGVNTSKLGAELNTREVLHSHLQMSKGLLNFPHITVFFHWKGADKTKRSCKQTQSP